MLMLGVDKDIFKHTLRIFTVIHYFKHIRIIWPFTIKVNLVPLTTDDHLRYR